MYANLGLHLAAAIPVILAAVCRTFFISYYHRRAPIPRNYTVPFPFLFYKYGESIRLKCKYAAEAAAILEKMRSGQKDREEAIASKNDEESKIGHTDVQKRQEEKHSQEEGEESSSEVTVITDHTDLEGQPDKVNEEKPVINSNEEKLK